MKRTIFLILFSILFICESYAQVTTPGLARKLRGAATLPATCQANDIYRDNDATSGQQIYLCESANSWVLQGDGGGSVEGTAVLSTGETGGTKFLREDGDGTSSWQTVVGGGATAWDDIGNPDADGSIAFAGFEQDITSTLDEANHSILRITNTDADTAADTDILTLKHNDGADVNIFYLRMVGDSDGSPTNDFLFSQENFTSLLPVIPPSEAYDATNWDSDTGAPQKDAIRDKIETLAPLTAPTFATSITGSYLTASEILGTDASKNIVSLAVATYPSLTELSYVKGLASAVQTQLNAKDAVTTAGRSLTRTTNDFAADAELYTHTFCYRLPASPVATDDDKSIWINDTANAFTVTKLWCESDQTVTMMGQVDDGSAADMDSVDLVCISTPDTDTSLDGDATIAAGDRVDLDVASVANTPTWAVICLTGTFDD